MKLNPRTTRMFLTLLAHRERDRVRRGLIAGQLGRFNVSPDGNVTWPKPAIADHDRINATPHKHL